jgi:hypothetical protein
MVAIVLLMLANCRNRFMILIHSGCWLQECELVETGSFRLRDREQEAVGYNVLCEV